MAFKMKGFPYKSGFKHDGHDGEAGHVHNINVTDSVQEHDGGVDPVVFEDKSTWVMNPGSGGKPYKGWWWNRAGEKFFGIPNKGEVYYTKKDPNVRYAVTTNKAGKATDVYYPPGHGMGGSMK
tara:strand:+ start:650 stop:1018 length:369 start_codon:yes stop_codon:yes gene_type:complete